MWTVHDPRAMISPHVEAFDRPEWSPLPYEGCINVMGKVLLDGPDLLLSMLRFDRHATIDEHRGGNDTVVACLEGTGFTSVGVERPPCSRRNAVIWPAGVPHRLWTEDANMTTLMVERPARPA